MTLNTWIEVAKIVIIVCFTLLKNLVKSYASLEISDIFLEIPDHFLEIFELSELMSRLPNSSK